MTKGNLHVRIMNNERSWEPERFWTSPDGKHRTLGVGKRKSFSREVIDCLMKRKGKSSVLGVGGSKFSYIKI